MEFKDLVTSIIKQTQEVIETDYVQVPKAEYKEAQRIIKKYYALEAAGVDNWEGYDQAMSNIEGDN